MVLALESKRTFVDRHNMVAFLKKPKGSEGFTQIIDFLNATPIRYALSVNPPICISFIKQFWATAKVITVNEENKIKAMVDGQNILITESSIRESLNLPDNEEIECLDTAAIFKGLEKMGYEKKNNKVKFYKGRFSSQWKFLIHTLLHCLSPKTTGWNEFGKTMASAVICLAKGKPFNFSKMILEGMIKTLADNGTCLLYPRFLQLIIKKQLTTFRTHRGTYAAPLLQKKVFSNLKNNGKDFSGKVTPLFPYMVNLPQKQGEYVMDEEHEMLEGDATSAASLEAGQAISNTSRSDEGSYETHELMDTDVQSGEDRKKLIKNLKACCTKLERDVVGLQKRTTKHGAKIKKLNLRVKYLEGQQRSKKAHQKGRNESRDSGEETTNAEGACDDMHGNEAVQQEQVVETNTSLGETAATSNVEEMAKVVHQDVSAATTNQVSTAEVCTTEEVAKTVDEAEVETDEPVAFSFDEVSTTEEVAKTVDEAEVETDEPVAFSFEDEEQKKLHGELMLAIIEADEVLQARAAKLYEDSTLSPDDRVQRLADLINARSQEVDLADFLNARGEEVASNKLIQPKKPAQRQKRKRNPTNAQRMSDMKTYLNRQGCYTYAYLSGKTYEELENLQNYIQRSIANFVPMDVTTEKLSKKQKIIEDKPAEKKNDSQRKEDSYYHDQMMVIIPETLLYVDPIQVRQPIMDWEIYHDKFGKAWKIIRSGGRSAVYKGMEDLIRTIDREDLDRLWELVQEKLKTKQKHDVKEQELWVELHRLYKPDPADIHWNFRCYDRSNVWKFYDSCNVHHISTQGGMDVFMLAEKEYPLSASLLAVLISTQIICEERTEAVNDLVERIFDQYHRACHASLKKPK
ncbi:hypothetical protein CTI12_AA052010 [Artemisia annua]|uniref:Synaptobrevin, longin-like domain protein n=1 Tax=Artemisia annua TaxID=35608 RepID=A0A2U1QB68_ARTAN|nr:hypothetical protein CTI12_AA052010 [Artemisia annua]